MICTLSSAHWQQASNLSAMRRFESIWKDKCAYQYNNKIVLTRCRCTQQPCVYARIRMITYVKHD